MDKNINTCSNKPEDSIDSMVVILESKITMYKKWVDRLLEENVQKGVEIERLKNTTSEVYKVADTGKVYLTKLVNSFGFGMVIPEMSVIGLITQLDSILQEMNKRINDNHKALNSEKYQIMKLEGENKMLRDTNNLLGYRINKAKDVLVWNDGRSK